MKKVTLPALAALAGASMAWPLAKAAEIAVVDLQSAQFYYDGARFEHELYDEGVVSYDSEEPDSSPSPPRMSPLNLSFYDLTPDPEDSDGYEDEPDSYDEEDDSYDDEETDYD